MKKILFLLVMILSVITLASCEVECAPSAEWASDANGHWHPCSIKGCAVKFQEEEHYFGEWTLSEEATEDSKATKERTCEVCSYVEIVEVGADEHFHSYSTEWSKDDENHWYECSCGDKSELGPHTWNDGITIEPATDTKPGQVAYECTICGKQKIVEVDANGHSHSFGSEWKKDASMHWNECGCGEKGNSANHEFGEWQVINDSTESQTGLKERTCQVCSYVESDVIPVKEHTHIPSNDYAFDDIEHWKTCSVCSEVLPKEAHQFGAWETQGETQKRSCNVCGHEESRSLTDTWDGTTVSQSLTGAGTEADPYLINSGADLAYVRDNAASLTGKYVKLMKDVDMNENNFMIITFGGTFDGNGHAIRGLVLTSESYSVPTGLFVDLEATGTIKNLSVYGTATTFWTTAGLVGRSAGNIENCKNYVNVTSEWDVGGVVAVATAGSITNCENHASVNGKTNTGGIVGWAKENVTLLNCKNYGTILSYSWAVGGIAGKSDSAISKCSNEGNVTGVGQVGGVVGYTVLPVTECSNSGTIEATQEQAGGVVGYTRSTVSYCDNNGNVKGTKCAGGVVANVVANAIVTNCNNNGEVSGGDGTAGVVGGLDGITKENITIQHCTNTGKVYGAKYAAGIVAVFNWNCNNILIDNCTNKGAVQSSTWCAAGIVGGLSAGEGQSAIVSNCVNEGTVTARDGGHAGIVGNLWGFASADSCTNKVAVAAGAGICGFDEGESSVTNCQDLSAAE